MRMRIIFPRVKSKILPRKPETTPSFSCTPDRRIQLCENLALSAQFLPQSASTISFALSTAEISQYLT